MSQFKQSKIDKLFNKKFNYLKLQRQKQSSNNKRKFRSKDERKFSKQNSRQKKGQIQKQKREQTQTINFLKQSYILVKQQNEKLNKKILKRQNKIHHQKTLIQSLQNKINMYEFEMKTKSNTIQHYEPTFCSTQKQSHNRSFSSKNIQNSANKPLSSISNSIKRNKNTIQSQQSNQWSKERYETIIKQLKSLSRTAIDRFKQLQMQIQQLKKEKQQQTMKLQKQLQKTKCQLKKLQSQNYQLIRSELLQIKQKKSTRANQSKKISKSIVFDSKRKENKQQKGTKVTSQSGQNSSQKINELSAKIKQYQNLLEIKDQQIAKLQLNEKSYQLKEEKFKTMLSKINTKVNNLQKEASQYQRNYNECKIQLLKVKQICSNTQSKLNAVLHKYKQKKCKYRQNQQEWEHIFAQFLKQMIILQQENIQIRNCNKSNKNLRINSFQTKPIIHKERNLNLQNRNESQTGKLYQKKQMKNSKQKRVTFIQLQ